jgi:hypothetical protein
MLTPDPITFLPKVKLYILAVGVEALLEIGFLRNVGL